jgi:hypothetical protein
VFGGGRINRVSAGLVRWKADESGGLGTQGMLAVCRWMQWRGHHSYLEGLGWVGSFFARYVILGYTLQQVRGPHPTQDLTGCCYVHRVLSLPRPAVALLTGDTLPDAPGHWPRLLLSLSAFVRTTYSSYYAQSRICVHGAFSSFAAARCQLSGRI